MPFQNVFSTLAVSNCGTWTYGGETKRVQDPLAPTPIVESTATHFRVTWTVAAQCCKEQGTELFPCDKIPWGEDKGAEQAFSTACEYKNSKQIKLCKNE